MSFEQADPRRRPEVRFTSPFEAQDVAQQFEGPQASYETAVEARRLAPLPELAGGEYYVLAPGRDLEVVEGHHHQGSRAIFMGHGELLMGGGTHRSHCRTPSYGGGNPHLPLATKLVSVFVHHRPVGALSETDRLILALGADDGVAGRMDTSGSWEMNTDCLRQMCAAVGLEYAVERYDYFPQMWEAHPEWVDAKVEFEVDHPAEEEAREVGLLIWYASALTILLGGGYMLAFVRSPLGPWYRALAFSGLALATALTLLSKSKTRMRRSMRGRAPGGTR